MIVRFLKVLMMIGATASAQSLLQTFGSGANAFLIDFVEIGNPGNAADTTGVPNPAGSVGYVYNIGKYEVSRDMIEKANNVGGLGIDMYNMTSFGGNGSNKPATGISWYEAARFVNWLNASTGNTEAYKFDISGTILLWSSADTGYNASNQYRNSLAKFYLPSTDEWYKAAYGSPNSIWYNYPTGSDSPPLMVSSGTTANTAVYGGPLGPADIDNAGGLSAWGAMGMGGNVWEWMETAYDGINDLGYENREIRGGTWLNPSSNLEASEPRSDSPSDNTSFHGGFRVAMVPEPSALSLIVVGFCGSAILRRRR